MIRYARWLHPLLAVTLSACAASQGFDRTEILDALHYRHVVAGEPLTTGTSSQRQAHVEPFRLGLYFVRTAFPTRQSIQTVEWISAEKDAMVAGLSPLRDDRIIRDVVVLADSTALTLSRQELRQAAARYGIDVLLLVDGIGAVDRRNNAYALLYPTILGAYLAPGTAVDALFVIDGTLWDPRTDTLLDRHRAEGQAQRVGAVVMVEDADALHEAKRRAIESFSASMVEQVRSLRNRQGPVPLPQP